MSKLPRAAIWTVATLLATVFVLVGLSKLTGPSALRWGERFGHWGYPAASQYVIGALEILAGVGVLIPKLRRRAAATLVAVMIGAMYTHAVNAEHSRLIPPLILATLVLVIMFDRGRNARRVIDSE
jgi:putative oxidoreductase